jgi:hypothetical protein
MQEEGRAEECHGETQAEEATENVVVQHLNSRHSRKTDWGGGVSVEAHFFSVFLLATNFPSLFIRSDTATMQVSPFQSLSLFDLCVAGNACLFWL